MVEDALCKAAWLTRSRFTWFVWNFSQQHGRKQWQTRNSEYRFKLKLVYSWLLQLSHNICRSKQHLATTVATFLVSFHAWIPQNCLADLRPFRVSEEHSQHLATSKFILWNQYCKILNYAESSVKIRSCQMSNTVTWKKPISSKTLSTFFSCIACARLKWRVRILRHHITLNMLWSLSLPLPVRPMLRTDRLVDDDRTRPGAETCGPSIIASPAQLWLTLSHTK